ncbi:MAG: helix-turn-helix domain-containing protein [Clostridia bacterium]|nr:helix-turn-helix domain-containing protein [Clostridia bacterium]
MYLYQSNKGRGATNKAGMMKLTSGQRLKEFRKEKGLTQKELGEQTGYSAAYISQVESGRMDVSAPLAEKLYTFYGVDPRWILYGLGKGKKSKLKEVRSEIGITQAEMAAQLGISAQYYGLMERGEYPVSDPVAKAIEQKWGISAGWLLFDIGDKVLRKNG